MLDRLKRVFKLTRLEFFFVINFFMLGVVMYWTGIVVEPTLDIAEQAKNETVFNKMLIETGVEQNQRIIESGENNTALLVELFDRQNSLLRNQILLVAKLTNTTNELESYGVSLTDQVETIIGQSDEVARMIGYFREQFGENFTRSEKLEAIQQGQILRNVTKLGMEIEQLHDRLVNITEGQITIMNRSNVTTNNP